MNRAFFSALVISVAAYFGASPASAQTFTLAEIGLQDSGACPQLAVRDRTSNIMVPLGCIASGGGPTFKLTPGGGVSMLAISPLDLTLAGTVGQPFDVFNPNAIMMGVGNQVSFCPRQSCVTSPTVDHQRASLLVSATTQDDLHSQEQTLAVMTTINKGLDKPWANNKAFVAGDNIRFGATNTVYRQTVASCTSAASGGFPSTNKGTNIVDGSCRWDWINDAAIGAKVGYYNETKLVAGGGASWGQAVNVELAPGSTPTFNLNTEFDFFNNSGTDCVANVHNCHGLYISIGGSNKVTDGVSLFSSNTDRWAARWGQRIAGDWFASESMLALDGKSDRAIGIGTSGIGGNTFAVAAIQDTSTAPASLSMQGNKSVATILDQTDSPVFASINGTKSLASIRDASTAPYGILLQGTYSTNQIQGNNWLVTPLGQVNGSSLNVKPNSSMQLLMDYDTAGDYGKIQSTHLGAYQTELKLNPDGGAVSIGPSLLKETSAPPASANAVCVTGTRTWDANYEYRCVAANTWKRAALSGW